MENEKIIPYKPINKIDSIVTHKYWGVIIFIIVIWLIFQATFRLGYYPMLGIEKLMFMLENLTDQYMPGGMIKDLILNGILKGIGGVIVFLPNIVILFFLLAMMVQTGYMARVSMVMDKVMKPLGLSGKSFISLIMGFGCNVPAIMAAQNIENKNSRLITILINPLMSCGSRFTVYVLLISAFFPNNPGTILFIIYFSTVILAVLLSLFLKKFVFKKAKDFNLTYLPKYKIPSAKKILDNIWLNSKLFLNKITGAILIASIIIWVLSYFPVNPDKSKQMETSYIGKIGKFIEPALHPLGFDWRMGISLMAGIAAKETITGTLSELYLGKNHQQINKSRLVESLRSQVYVSGPRVGQHVFNPLVALSFMFFVAIYTPCVATCAVISKTTSRKWTVFVLIYTSILAWLLSFGIYQIGSLIIS
jgi:ferrous iron transport protein B